jgi:hypothetical protein
MEDFAEAAMIWSLKKAGMDVYYAIHAGSGNLLFDVDPQWQSPQFQTKIQWLERFFARTDLKYEFP